MRGRGGVGDFSRASISLLGTSRSNGKANLGNKVTAGNVSANTLALVSVHVLKCLHFFPPSPFFFSSLHTNTRAHRKETTDETACVISTRHISKVVCCVITPCLPPAHETHRLSLARCARLLHISPGGEQHGTSIILLRLRAAAPGLLIYHFLYDFTSLGER